MISYMKRHEKDILRTLAASPTRESLGELIAFHDKQIAWLQQERLAHLVTTMFFGLFFVLSLGFTMWRFSLPAMVMTGLLLLMVTAYVFHYYRLENTVQRWYSISNRMRAKLLEG